MRFPTANLVSADTVIQAIRYGDRWYVPIYGLCRVLSLHTESERRRLSKLLSFWPTVSLYVAHRARHEQQPCLLLDKLPHYLSAVAAGLRLSKKRARIEAVLMGMEDAIQSFLQSHDDAYAAKRKLACAEKEEIASILEDARRNERERVIRHYSREAALAAAKKRKRLSIDQFRRIKELSATGMMQKHVAKEVGCSRSAVCLVLKGKYPYPEDVAGLV